MVVGVVAVEVAVAEAARAGEEGAVVGVIAAGVAAAARAGGVAAGAIAAAARKKANLFYIRSRSASRPSMLITNFIMVPILQK